MNNKVYDPYEDWEHCPFCGGQINWGEWFYDYNMESQIQERSCKDCGQKWHAVYKFAGNLNSSFEEFEEEEDDDE